MKEQKKKDDLSKRCDDSTREAADLKIRRPQNQTSNTRGLKKPAVEVQSKPLPKNDEDSLYLVWPSRDEATATAERPRNKLGQYAPTKD